MHYSLAPDGVFWSWQSEGHLRHQMPFIRLAGCSIGCVLCDTDYSKAEEASHTEIRKRVQALTPVNLRDRWVWISGGEPLDWNLKPLIDELREHGYSIAVATAGHSRMIEPVDWLSVSPHDPAKWVQKFGSELKIVDGLNGFFPKDFELDSNWGDFSYRFVQPLWIKGKETEESMKRCLFWVKTHCNWTISRQEHKQYGMK